mmetsp:Transcript_25411/g.50915  ORF Transcript_25411/g.50915 Transcript_25411/m.50915 type:complete len:217 (+) Transcript_25411:642-1292(+)
MMPFFSPSSRASASMRPPREVLMITTPGFIAAIVCLLMTWYVLGRSGRCSEMMSLCAITSATEQYSIPIAFIASDWYTSCPRRREGPNDLRIVAVICPILPVPRMPMTLPLMVKPSSPARLKLCSRTRLYAFGSLRISARSNPTACSATASGLYCGTRITVMPSSSAVYRSMWLKPALRVRISFTPSSPNFFRHAASALSLTKTQTASHPRASSAV